MMETYNFNGEGMTREEFAARLLELGLDASMFGMNIGTHGENVIDRGNVIDYKKHPDNPNLFVPDPNSRHNREYFPGVF